MDDPSAFADEDLVKFLAAPVPREIPPWLRKAALRDAAAFSGLLFGLVFFVMGVVFSATFFPRRQLDQWRLERGESREVPGIIVSSEDTNLSINKRKVRAYAFEFTGPDGRKITGECFTTGRRWQATSGVTVVYAVNEPVLACVKGARLGKTGLAGGFVLLFPLIGAGIVAWWVRARRRTVHLLTYGQLGDFTVVSVESTSVQINKQRQFKITLRRIDGDAPSEHTVRWHQPNRLELVNRRKESGQAIFGLFDPRKRGQIVLPELWVRPRG